MMGFSNMRNGVFASVTVHLLFVIFTLFGLPNLFTSRDYSIVIIPVEIVTDEQLNAPPPPAAPEPKPEPKPEAAAPPPPPEPKPEPKVVEAPPPPPPVEKPKPPKKKEPPKPKPTPLAKAKPQSKPKPPKKPKSFASVLKDLDKLEKKKPAPKVNKESTPKDKDKPSPDQQVAEQASITEIERLKQLIRQQIEPCWSPPVGAAEAEDLAITIFIRVDREGFVREARVIDAPAMALNTYVQAAADAARRAVLNPRCQPFELPINRYDLWKEIRFNFDPREMLG